MFSPAKKLAALTAISTMTLSALAPAVASAAQSTQSVQVTVTAPQLKGPVWIAPPKNPFVLPPRPVVVEAPELPEPPPAPPAAPRSSGWVNPLPNNCLGDRDYGTHWHPIHHEWRMHWGVDYKVRYGTHIQAAAAGKVSWGNDPGGAGLYIVIAHRNNTFTVYQHMAERWVGAGKDVEAGQVIGIVGSTGGSTGPHLHFETHYGLWDDRVDPVKFMRDRGVTLRYCG